MIWGAAKMPIRKCEQVTLIVSTEDPFPIMICDPGIQNLLGYRADDISRQSIARICGPSTDLSLLASCIADTSLGHSTALQLILYSTARESRKISVCVSPLRDAQGTVLGCTMTLSLSQGVRLTDALCEGLSPQAILSACPPYSLIVANSKFSSAFGLQLPHLPSSTSINSIAQSCPRIC